MLLRHYAAGMGALAALSNGATPLSMMAPADASASLPIPLDLLVDTNLGGKELERVYCASSDGWSALEFHANVDGVGSVLIVGELESGAYIGGYSPTGWESRDDYRATPRAFLFCSKSADTSAAGGDNPDDEDVAWLKLSVLGPGDVAIFDYARGGPQFGAADLVFGAPLSAVMGGFAGPDTMDDTATAGDLRIVTASLGGSYERMPPGAGAFPTGVLVELEAYCSAAISQGGGIRIASRAASAEAELPAGGPNEAEEQTSKEWWQLW